jgi:hypothetical protein
MSNPPKSYTSGLNSPSSISWTNYQGSNVPTGFTNDQINSMNLPSNYGWGQYENGSGDTGLSLSVKNPNGGSSTISYNLDPTTGKYVPAGNAIGTGAPDTSFWSGFTTPAEVIGGATGLSAGLQALMGAAGAAGAGGDAAASAAGTSGATVAPEAGGSSIGLGQSVGDYLGAAPASAPIVPGSPGVSGLYSAATSAVPGTGAADSSLFLNAAGSVPSATGMSVLDTLAQNPKLTAQLLSAGKSFLGANGSGSKSGGQSGGGMGAIQGGIPSYVGAAGTTSAGMGLADNSQNMQRANAQARAMGQPLPFPGIGGLGA